MPCTRTNFLLKLIPFPLPEFFINFVLDLSLNFGKMSLLKARVFKLAMAIKAFHSLPA